jgi:hypothetical protein
MVQKDVSTQTAGTQTVVMLVIVSLAINLHHPTIVIVNSNYAHR